MHPAQNAETVSVYALRTRAKKFLPLVSFCGLGFCSAMANSY